MFTRSQMFTRVLSAILGRHDRITQQSAGCVGCSLGGWVQPITTGGEQSKRVVTVTGEIDRRCAAWHCRSAAAGRAHGLTEELQQSMFYSYCQQIN